jgi:hypothetical protein
MHKRPKPIFAILFKPFGLLAPKTVKIFDFPTFKLGVYLMKLIPETRRVH